MSDILKVFTPEQMVDLMRDSIISDNVGISNFNAGSRIRSILEAVALVESTTGFEYLDALRKSIPIALYDGLNFTRKGATVSSGFLRFFRLPEFTINYTGSDSSVTLTVTATQLSLITSGTPADDLTLLFSTYTTTSAVQAAINAHGSYTATLVGLGTANSTTIYQYSGIEIVGSTNYLNSDGRDIMVGSAALVTLVAGLQASIDDMIFLTTASGSIAAGDATSAAIAAESSDKNSDVNILANAIDTLNGKGNFISGTSGVEYVINDSAFSGGVDEESDDDRAIRFQVYVQGLSGSTVRGIEAAVLSLDAIKSVTVLERYPQPGINTVVADDGSGNLSAAQITEIQELLDGDPADLVNYPGYRAAGITVNVQAPSVVGVDITVTVTRIGTLSDATEITNTVQSAIENYVNTRKLGDNVILSEIVKVGKLAHPSVFDLTISVPSANVDISTTQLARTGSGTGSSVTINLTTLTSIP